MLIFMLLPISTWAQFDNFVEIEYITKGSEKTLNYDVFPCGLDTKVIVNRTAAKENNLTIEFKGFDGSSIERETLTVGASTYIKSFGLENHLVILMGTESGMYEENVLTRELKTGLDILMTNLKDKCKEVLKLWSLSYNMTEIAEKLAYTNTQVVMNKKNLCLRELRKQLADNPKLADLII